MSTRFLDRLDALPSTTRDLAAGAKLFERGDTVRDVHAVISGEVQLLRRQPDGAAFVLQRAGPGAILAEASVLSACYHCGAEAVSAARVRIWSREQVRTLIETDLAGAVGFARHLAGEVRSARLRAEIASLRRVSDRLDTWLAWHDDALPAKGQWHQLARELNVSPEALYRELGKRRQPA